ncbi:hypothetical protein [Myxosarcina sp. GI1]|uniref:hypothetical protein n=1 Tax=Myxosarcina sp. GI1 TaxID=1541065 RepID=UPI001C106E0E|nr:hypothetical protein [Myxosarcina sp. GI1]
MTTKAKSPSNIVACIACVISSLCLLDSCGLFCISMNQKSQQRANANKIKKWLFAAAELSNKETIFALPITRLTSIKSLCTDEITAQQFALYLSQRVQQEMNQAESPSELTSEEWSTHKNLVADAIALQESYLAVPTDEEKQSIWRLLKQIDSWQGDDYRNVHWTTVHFVRSGYLLKLDYALRCFVERDFACWVYKLAREYVERYQPSYGSGLIPDSVPMLLEIAEFWCWYYFDCSLRKKFPQELIEINQEQS